MRKLLAIIVLAFGVGVAANDANAQFCPGVSPWVFDDVAAADPFCGFITELAERGVTLGCAIIDANHRLYCPDANVSRKSMSAFMVRLADSILPLTCAVGQVMKWDGVNWVCSNDNTGNTGTVTSVATGAGLTGGPITTTGTIGIATGGVTQPMLSAAGGTNGQVLATDGTSLQWLTLPTIPAILPITSGGTGADTAAGARANLGLGSIATASASVGTNYLTKATSTSSFGNSQIQDNGTNIGINFSPQSLYRVYIYNQQQTAAGDGQATLYAQRDRNSQNNGSGYGQVATNHALMGQNFWGDVYTFGVAGFNYNDFNRTGGVLGAEVGGAYWGSLGYKNSANATFGVYGSNAYGSGAGDPVLTGRAALAATQEGIGGGFFGGMIGTMSSGTVMGHVSSGEMFASYNIGNVFTSGVTANVVSVSAKATSALGADRAPAYANTSPDLKVYDSGVGAISGGLATIPFSAVYAGMLGAAPIVTVTPVGAPAQLYVKSVSTDGFTVGSADGSSVQFFWIAVGSRIDAAMATGLPAEVASKDFDANMKAAMSNDADTQRDAKPLWWDGSKVRFDAAPARAMPAKVPPK